jgi:hypothetical protein
MFDVVTILPCSTLSFEFLTISFRHKHATTFPTATFLPSCEAWISLDLRLQVWRPTLPLIDLTFVEVNDIISYPYQHEIQTRNFHILP